LNVKKLWFLSLIIVVLLALPALAACGTTEEPATTAPPATSATTAPPATSGSGDTTPTTAPASTDTTLGAPVKLYVGGTFALTGAYAEDCAAVLAGFEDYVKWVNENHVVAPWLADKAIPANIDFELLWGDDALAPDKTVTIYQDLLSKGLLVERVSGTPQVMALKDLLREDNVGSTSQGVPPATLMPPGNVFLKSPIYTDAMYAVAQWFMANWKDTTRKPRVAYLTADAALGRTIDIPEMQAALEQLGYEFAGAQFVPLVPTAAPTTQLAWLKDQKVDLTLGIMVNPGAQPTVKEALRLGMGPDQAYKITFAFCEPGHLQIMVPDLGEAANGVVVGGDYCAVDADVPGIKFSNLLQDTYRSNNRNENIMYQAGLVEAMLQVEALRLASLAGDPSKLTPEDVLKKGFWQIKGFDTGGICITPLTYGEGDVQGLDSIRIQQVQAGKIVELGEYPMPTTNILPAAK
jgi:hypothetical protein